MDKEKIFEISSNYENKNVVLSRQLLDTDCNHTKKNKIYKFLYVECPINDFMFLYIYLEDENNFIYKIPYYACEDFEYSMNQLFKIVDNN